MILPKNGRVIIIDDESAQAIPLISALSKFNIATTYFDARKETLPLKRFNDVRVVFLDINLVGGAQPSWHTEKAILINNITSIIEPQTPYILFVWSVNETDHFEDLVKLFDEDLNPYKPIVPLIKMDKNEMFNQNTGDDGIVKWTLNHSIEETIQLIKQKINEGISTIDSFEALLKWENIVSDSTTDITNEIVFLANGKSNLNEELKKIYYKLAEAMWGNTVKGKGATEIITQSLSVFNKMFLDNLDNNLRTRLTIDYLKDVVEPEDFSYDTICLLNTKLILTNSEKGVHIPGNIYKIKDEIGVVKSIINELKDRSSFYPDFCEKAGVKLSEAINPNGNLVNRLKSDFNVYFIAKIDEIISKSVYIGLEITPICDYTQGKRIYPRILPGLIIEDAYYKYFKTKTESCTITPPLDIKGTKQRLLFEFRYLNTHEAEKFLNEESIFRLREQMITEIQSKLAGNINRPGVIFLQ